MIILIAGSTHTGKTLLAQKILEKYSIPYLSLDHLKMGLIRSGKIILTPLDKEDLITEEVWPIAREIIKTAIENNQNLTIEGCYIPFDWKKDFDEKYLYEIFYCSIVFSEEYIEKNFENIKKYGSIIEKRIEDSYCDIQLLKEENNRNLEGCLKYGLNYILVTDNYNVDLQFLGDKFNESFCEK